MNFICPSRHLFFVAFFILSIGLAVLSSCSTMIDRTTSGGPGTAADADKFIKDAEQKLFDLNLEYSRADWVKSTFITDDTEAISAEANEEVIAATTEFAEQSKRFETSSCLRTTARKIKLLKLALVLPGAERSSRARRAHEARGLDGRRLRQGQILSRRRTRKMPEP